MTREEIYDQHVAPLLDYVNNLCIENNIPFLAVAAVEEFGDIEGHTLAVTADFNGDVPLRMAIAGALVSDDIAQSFSRQELISKGHETLLAAAEEAGLKEDPQS
ncbi:MAG: hypothetical protein ABIH23_32615 [bacterium]